MNTYLITRVFKLSIQLWDDNEGELMTLLIDALNKADKERRNNSNITFVDDVQTTQNLDNHQSKINPTANGNRESNNDFQSSPKTSQKPTTSSTQANSTLLAGKSAPKTTLNSNPIPAYIPPKINNSGRKISFILMLALVLLTIGSVLFWHIKSPSGLVVNVPKSANNQSFNSLAETNKNNVQALNADVDEITSNITNVRSENVAVVSTNTPPSQYTKIEKNNIESTDEFTRPVIKRSNMIKINQNTKIAKNFSKTVSTNLSVEGDRLSKSQIPSKPKSDSQILSSAYEYVINENYQMAEDLYQQVLRKNPTNIEALQNMGVIAYNQGQYEKSRFWFEKVLSISPNNRFSKNVLFAMESFDGETLIEEAQSSNPAQLNYIQGTINAEKGQWALAQNRFATAVAYDQKNPDYVYNLAVACDNLGDWECALQNYQRSLLNYRLQRGNFSLSVVRSRILEILGAGSENNENQQ